MGESARMHLIEFKSAKFLAKDIITLLPCPPTKILISRKQQGKQ